MNFVFIVVSLALGLTYVTAGNHNKTLPPTKNGEPVHVASSMYILNLYKLDEEQGEYSVQVYFRQKWQDDRLRFNGNGPKYLTPEDLQSIWVPDLFFVQEVWGKLHTLTVPNIFARLDTDGTILYSIRATIKLNCRMNLKYHPHNTQTCAFAIESYAYQTKDIKLSWNLHPTGPAVSMDPNINLPHYKILNMEYRTETEKLASGNYSRLVVELQFQRKIGFFLTKLFLPYILLVLVSYLGFWIHSKFALQRLTLLIVVLFIMMAIAFDINSHVPTSAHSNGTEVWINCCIVLVFAAFLECIYVSTLKGPLAGEQDEKTIILSGLESSEKDENKEQKPYITWGKKSAVYNWLKSPTQIDFALRIAYPILFGGFNLIYWCYYAA